ncbi:MAG: hypothetical protein QM681_20100 [Novosphingobium sp.]
MIRAKVRLSAPAILCGVLSLAMTACSASGGYPSLAQRDVERVSGTASAAPGDSAQTAPALPPASADLVTRLAGLVKVAEQADRQFQSNRPAAERASASAGSTGSDSWSGASVALAKLESSRSSGMTALAELDVLYADARDKAPVEESPEVKAIADARAQVAALLDAQDKVLAGLAGRLKT